MKLYSQNDTSTATILQFLISELFTSSTNGDVRIWAGLLSSLQINQLHILFNNTSCIQPSLNQALTIMLPITLKAVTSIWHLSAARYNTLANKPSTPTHSQAYKTISNSPEENPTLTTDSTDTFQPRTRQRYRRPTKARKVVTTEILPPSPFRQTRLTSLGFAPTSQSQQLIANSGNLSTSTPSQQLLNPPIPTSVLTGTRMASRNIITCRNLPPLHILKDEKALLYFILHDEFQMEIITTPGDGNCFFHAITLALNTQLNPCPPASVATQRLSVASTIQHAPHHFSHIEGALSALSFSDYLRQIKDASGTHYADQNCFQAMADMLGTQIKVLSALPYTAVGNLEADFLLRYPTVPHQLSQTYIPFISTLHPLHLVHGRQPILLCQTGIADSMHISATRRLLPEPLHHPPVTAPCTTFSSRKRNRENAPHLPPKKVQTKHTAPTPTTLTHPPSLPSSPETMHVPQPSKKRTLSDFWSTEIQTTGPSKRPTLVQSAPLAHLAKASKRPARPKIKPQFTCPGLRKGIG